MPTTRASQLSRTAPELTQARVRESGILAGILLQPQVLGEIEGALEDMRFLTPELSDLRDRILSLDAPDDLRGALAETLGRDPMAGLTNVAHLSIHPLSRKGLDPGHVRDVILDAITRHEAILTDDAERSDARAALAGAEDDTWGRRLRQAHQERQAADSKALNALNENDLKPGESAFQKMLDQEAWRRSK